MSRVPHIRGWEGSEEGGGVRGMLTLPVDKDDRVVCPAGQTDGHSTWPCHQLRRHTVEQNGTPSYPILIPLSSPKGSVLVLCDLTGF